MFRTLTAAIVLSTGLLAVFTPRAASSPAPVPGPGAVISMHIQLFAAIDRGDAGRASAFVGPRSDTSLFLTRDGVPSVHRGRDAVAAQLAKWARDSADGSHRTEVVPVASDCHSADLSYAVLEIVRTTETEAGPVVQRYLSTSLVQHRDGGWRLMHWHLSPAETPHDVEFAAK